MQNRAGFPGICPQGQLWFEPRGRVEPMIPKRFSVAFCQRACRAKKRCFVLQSRPSSIINELDSRAAVQAMNAERRNGMTVGEVPCSEATLP